MDAKEIESMFEQINEARIAMSEATAQFRKDLEAPQTIVNEINAKISEAMAPYAEIVDTLKADIETAVLENAQSFNTDAGACTFVKGRKGAVKWNDEALNGAVAGANGDLDFLMAFREERPSGKPSTRFKMICV